MYEIYYKYIKIVAWILAHKHICIVCTQQQHKILRIYLCHKTALSYYGLFCHFASQDLKALGCFFFFWCTVNRPNITGEHFLTFSLFLHAAQSNTLMHAYDGNIHLQLDTRSRPFSHRCFFMVCFF